MARANRHYVPGYTWHITHRYHKKEFLLKFEKDRERYLWWLFEARKRFDLCILNYTVTSNHVHILVVDTGDQAIPRSMQLIAGRTGQEYNARKNRKGAFWEDRYHATAVQTSAHLMRCMLYIDLNMVRAGVVRHPSLWPCCGYHEIVNPPKRYARVDQSMLMIQLGMNEREELGAFYQEAVDEMLRLENRQREARWTESLAVGDEAYVNEVKTKLLSRATGRKTQDWNAGVFELREPVASYNPVFDPKNSVLSLENTVKWETND